MDGSTGIRKAWGCSSLWSGLAKFLQLDALPNANHSESVVCVFAHSQQSWQRPRLHGAFYVPPAQEPVGNAGITVTLGWCFLCATGTGQQSWLRPRSHGAFYVPPAQEPVSNVGIRPRLVVALVGKAGQVTSTSRCCFMCAPLHMSSDTISLIMNLHLV